MTFILGIIAGLLLSLIATVVSFYATKRDCGIGRIQREVSREKATVTVPPERGSEEERLFDLLHDDK